MNLSINTYTLQICQEKHAHLSISFSLSQLKWLSRMRVIVTGFWRNEKFLHQNHWHNKAVETKTSMNIDNCF